MKTVYVVMGTTGEYSDRSEWAVMAYANEAAAQKHVTKATERANELRTIHKSTFIPKGENEFDGEMSMDYTGTSYYIYTVPFTDGGER